MQTHRSIIYVMRIMLVLTAGVLLITDNAYAQIIVTPLVIWDPQGDLIAVADDFNVTIVDGNTLTTLHTIPGSVEGMTWESRVTPAWSPDSSKIALFNDWNVEIWDKPWSSTEATLISTIYLDGWPRSIAWSPDGTVIAIAHLEMIVIADPVSGNIMRHLEGPWSLVYEVIWDTNGRLILTGKGRFTAIIDHVTGNLYSSYYTTYEGIISNFTVAVSPDNMRLAIGDNDGFIEIRNNVQTSGERIEQVDQRIKIPPYTDINGNRISSAILDLKWSPDGSLIVSTSWDGAVRIWNPNNGANVETITERGVYYPSAAWRPNSFQIALGNPDNTVSIIAPIAVPVANAGSDLNLIDSNNGDVDSIILDGSDSTDSDGTIVSYSWTETDIEIATGAQPDVALTVGTHTITLTVTDNDGLTDTDEVVITIRAPSPTSSR